VKIKFSKIQTNGVKKMGKLSISMIAILLASAISLVLTVGG